MSGGAEENVHLDDIVKVVPDAALTEARLSAEEAFVLSRVDGTTTIDVLCLITGLGEDGTVDVLRRLRSMGLVTFGDESPVRSSAPVVEEPERDRAAGRSSAAAAPSLGTSDAIPHLGGIGTGDYGGVGQASSSWQEGLERVLEREDGDDIDLERDARRRIRLASRKLSDMSFFELLNVSLDVDAKGIRRAYFQRSKEFHPDRYYTKNLGPYKAMLAEIFRQVKGAYEFLLDDDKRHAYRSTIEQERENQTLNRQVAAAAARAAGDAESSSSPSGTDHVSPARRVRRRSAVVKGLVQRNLRERLRGRRSTPSGSSPGVPTVSQTKAVEANEPVSPEPPDGADRESRREADRTRLRRRRRQTIVAPISDQQQRADGFYQQGVRQLEEGKHLAAAASLKLALTYDPNNPDYRRRYEEASAVAKGINAENLFKRALFEESVGRVDTAAQFYQKAADMQQTVTHLRAACLATMAAGDLPAAKEYATKAVQLEPSSVDARLALVRVYLASGLTKNARREVTIARRLDPNNPEAKELLKQVKKA